MTKSAAVWVLHGARIGDNAQASLISERLGLSAEVKPLSFNLLHRLPNWALGESVAGLDFAGRAALSPPWPRLVIATGKRTAPIARYIRRQSQGMTKLVHVGRPRAPLEAFDLVVTTPQYGLPPAPNVIELALPFAIPKTVSQAVLARWREAWKDLPRPWIAVAVGAAKFPQHFGLRVAEAMVAELGRLAGSLIVIASPRTDREIMNLIGRKLGGSVRLYPWGDANPYQAALRLADRFVVTSDSLSMLSEAIATGKKVDIFRLPVLPLAVSWPAKRGLAAILARHGLVQSPRNMPAVIDGLLRHGYATLLGEEGTCQAPPLVGYETVIARIRELIGRG
ncbi:MAG: mitochondrial fission ELM1 family protein [Rhizobiales bacterium]|nr:mitochondrial fission ELM1 family protein [Hyphomicrobiales bacterium]